MRRLIGILVVLMLCLGLAGCAEFKGQARTIVAEADNLATQNAAIVEKLVLDRQSVTEDEEVIAIRNSRALKVLTGALVDVVGEN